MKEATKIMIESNGLLSIGSYAASLWSKRKVVIICDRLTFEEHGAQVIQYLTIMEFDVQTFILSELLYTTTTISAIYQFLSAHNISKNDGIIGLGSQSICQLSSYVATTYCDGIPLIQLPTTLVAQLALSLKHLKHETRSQSILTGVLIDSSLSNLSTESELKAAQSLLLRSGYPQDHMCQRELRNRIHVENYQLNFKKIVRELSNTLIKNEQKKINQRIVKKFARKKVSSLR